MNGEIAHLVENIRRVLGRGPELRLAILFGSAATDSLRPHSDLDVAILPYDSDLPLATELELQRDLERACGRPIDLVRIDHASTLLRWEIARRGIVVLATPPAERPRFLAAAACEYGDFAPALRAAAGRYRRRLVERVGHAALPLRGESGA